MEARERTFAGAKRHSPVHLVQPAIPQFATHPLLGLQASIGNHAVAALVTNRGRSTHVVQRAGPGTTTPPAQAGANLPFMATAKRQAAELKGNAAVHLGNLALYNTAANLAFRAFEPKRIQAAERYSTAFEIHARVLSAARVAAMNQDMVESLVIGAVASLAVAAAGPALVGLGVVTAAATQTAAWAVGGSIASSAAGTLGAGMLATNVDTFDPVGSKDSERVTAFRQMHELQSRARLVAALGPSLGFLLGNIEYVEGQIKLHEEGGETEMNWDQTIDLLANLQATDRTLQSLDAELKRASGELARLQQHSTAWQVPGTSDLEQKIWVVWIAQVTDSDVLDRDEIEDHLHATGVLGPGSLLGVDFGKWTSEEDEQEAISAAKRERSRLDAAANPSGAPGG